MINNPQIGCFECFTIVDTEFKDGIKVMPHNWKKFLWFSGSKGDFIVVICDDCVKYLKPENIKRLIV